MKTAIRAAALAAALSVVCLAPSAQAVNSLTPASVSVTLKPGESTTIKKSLSLDPNAAKADILIAIDTTGSMSGAINQAKSEATALVNQLQSQIPDAQFAVVDFRDAGDGPAEEYNLRQAMTGSASAVQTAINAMFADGGGDLPEATNYVIERATNDAAIGWRAGSRQFVVHIGDAAPHSPTTSACGTQSADSHGLTTAGVMAGLTAAKRTIFMVAVGGILPCYQSIAALGYSGSQAVQLGASFSQTIVDAVNAASANINQVDLATDPVAFASWVTFSPAPPYGPLTAPATLAFDEKITVPLGTAPGVYEFDVVAYADGGERAREHVKVTVPALVRSGRFVCRGTGLNLRLLSLNLGSIVTANPLLDPCKDERHSLVDVNKVASGLLGALVTGNVVEATSDASVGGPQPAAGDRADGDAKTTGLKIALGTTVISAQAVTAHATAQCVAPSAGVLALDRSTSGDVVGLKIGSTPIAVNGGAQQSIPLGIGTLHVNWRGVVNGVAIRRGLWLESALASVVVSQAEAGAVGNPCASA